MDNYIVATLKPWNIATYNNIIRNYPGNWHLVTKKKDLTIDLIESLKPRYVFFPHWSYIVPKKILELSECIGFHETDLPFGRGGSPIQNLIVRGFSETYITAFQMTEEMDAGPIYMKKKLCLEGVAEEIFVRSSIIISSMIKAIITKNPTPRQQQGTPVYFERRKPAESKVPLETKNLKEIFDFIRMLDADGYPKAFIEYENFIIRFSKPILKTDNVIAEVKITLKKEEK